MVVVLSFSSFLSVCVRWQFSFGFPVFVWVLRFSFLLECELTCLLSSLNNVFHPGQELIFFVPKRSILLTPEYCVQTESSRDEEPTKKQIN